MVQTNGAAGIVHARQLGTERQAAVLVDRQLLDFAAQEVGLRRRLPEPGRRRQGCGSDEAAASKAAPG